MPTKMSQDCGNYPGGRNVRRQSRQWKSRQKVLAVRDLHPTWHPTWRGRKIHWTLKHQNCQQVPAASTITAILRRAGRLSPDTPSPAVRRYEKAFPNEAWQVDFKGHHATALAGATR